MNKKAGRPESKNVPYFPHQTEPTIELKFIERKHGAEGYRAYYRLLESVTKADYHHRILKTENQYLGFLFDIGSEKEIVEEIISYLVEVGFIDQELWEQEKIIWIQHLVDYLRPVWYKRGRPLPERGDYMGVSDTRNMYEVSKEVSNEPTNQLTKGSKEFTPIEELEIEDIKKVYKEIDVDKTLDKYLSYYPNNPSVEGFEGWLDQDRGAGRNLKKVEWFTYDTGNIKAYCSKCGNKDLLGDIRGTSEMSYCCKAEYVPEPPPIEE